MSTLNIEHIEQAIMRVQDHLLACYRPARDWPHRQHCIKVGRRQEVKDLQDHLFYLRLQLQHANGKLAAYRNLANSSTARVT